MRRSRRSSSPLRGAATCRRARCGRPGSRSSSPLRGAATKRSGPNWRRRVKSSSPLRGAATGRLHLRDSPCPGGHHRPYEGQQHHRERRMRGRHGGHHRPYEGQQRALAAGGRARRRPVIIAPTRGSNLKNKSLQATMVAGSSSPLRGAATCRCGWGSGHGITRHHRPYEGQQRDQLVMVAGQVVQVIIAPTRGSNADR